jgi:hypothetical protein
MEVVQRKFAGDAEMGKENIVGRTSLEFQLKGQMRCTRSCLGATALEGRALHG